MTELADKIVSALFDLADSDGGLVKSRAVERVDEVLATMSFGCKVPRGAVAIWVSPDGVDFIYPDEQTEADKQRETKAQEFAKRVTDRSHKEDWDAWKKSIASVTMPKQFFVGLDKAERPDFWSLAVKCRDGMVPVAVGTQTTEFSHHDMTKALLNAQERVINPAVICTDPSYKAARIAKCFAEGGRVEDWGDGRWLEIYPPTEPRKD